MNRRSRRDGPLTLTHDFAQPERARADYPHMAKGVLERIDEKRWRLIVEHDDGAPPDVFEGPLRLLFDVIDDLSVDVQEVRMAKEPRQ